MAQSRIFDLLQDYTFWVFDASGFNGNPLFSVFDPTMGFSSVTAPEWNLELREIQPGNWEYKRRVVKAADIGPITLQNGARFWNSDFYNWMTNALKGVQPVRRNLVVVHYMGFRLARHLFRERDQSSVGNEVGINATGLVGVPLDRIPARAWYLQGCLPTRYKAGSDFDANSSEVSIAELEFQPEDGVEMTISTLSPIAARTFSIGLVIGESIGLPGL